MLIMHIHFVARGVQKPFIAQWLLLVHEAYDGILETPTFGRVIRKIIRVKQRLSSLTAVAR
jgi:hypothetical protein